MNNLNKSISRIFNNEEGLYIITMAPIVIAITLIAIFSTFGLSVDGIAGKIVGFIFSLCLFGVLGGIRLALKEVLKEKDDK